MLQSQFKSELERSINLAARACDCPEFKKDVEELCDECPLTAIICGGIADHIIPLVEQKREVLTEDQFQDYVQSEVKNAILAMEHEFRSEFQAPKEDKFRGARILTYLFNKERIKALNAFGSLIAANGKLENPHPRYFKDIRAWKLFEFWCDEVKEIQKGKSQPPLREFSFIYRAMQRDGLIYNGIGESEFRLWLTEEGIVELHSQLLSYDNSITSQRKTRYDTARTHFI